MDNQQQPRLLYLGVTLLNLTSEVVLQMTENHGVPADMVLLDTSDFSGMKEKLEKTGLFEHVDECHIMDEIAAIKANSTEAARMDATHRLIETFVLPRLEQYTDMYINLDSLNAKLFYYVLLRHGVKPRVHIADEGTACYITPAAPLPIEFFRHARYGEDSFFSQLISAYLYEPSLYVGGNEKLQLRNLTKIDRLSPNQKEVLLSLFPAVPQVQEKVIFFEGCFHGDGYISTEYDLLMKLVERVGKENVIVKRHPRNKIDRFTDRGIKVMETINIPWEVMLLTQSLKGKLLVSAASYTCMSPMTIYGKKYNAMILNDLMDNMVPFLADPKFTEEFDLMIRLLNRESMQVWTPRSVKEMYAQLDYFMAAGEDEDNE